MASASRILILTAPHLCRNPRVVKEATTLGAAGYEVTVLSISTQSRLEKIDLELMQGLPFRRVVLDYSSNALSRRAAYFVQRSATWAARWMRRRLRIEMAQSLGPAGSLLSRARRTPADLTIVHTEIPIWAAQHLIKEGRRVAVDVEDWYSQDLLFADRQSRPLRLLRRAERYALNRCAYASATSRAMAEALHRAFGGVMPAVIHNSFPLQRSHRAQRPLGSDPAKLIWFSQTIGPGRGLELFVSAWCAMKEPSDLFLLGEPRTNYSPRLLARVPPERRGMVHFLPLVTPGELPDRLSEFDVGLALESHFPVNRDITITNKILQYMNAGLAIVATDTAGQQEVMSAVPDSGILIQAHETTRVARQLDELVADRARLRSAQLAARAAAEQRYCWEHDSTRLLDLVAQALHQS